MSLLFKLADVYMEATDEHIIVDDVELLLGQLCMNRVAGIAYCNVEKLSGLLLPREFRNTLRDIWKENRRNNDIYIQDLLYINRILMTVNVKYAFLKGVFLISQLYDAGQRTSNDYDVLLSENDLDIIEKLLLQKGFIQGRAGSDSIVPASRKEILLSRMNYGQTVPFVKRVDGHYIVIDLNISVDYKPQKTSNIVERLLDECDIIDVKGEQVITLSTPNFIIHLCCHLYKEATTIYWVKNHRDLQLYKFSDINVIMRKYMNDTFARTLAEVIIQNGLCKECYYTLYNAKEIFPNLGADKAYEMLLMMIKPDNLSYMKEIIDPINKKTYVYSNSFVEWFENKNRYSSLVGLEGEK